ncbi:MAG TPA: ABC transporter permease subunit [Candidatus Limnocylindria bacterium]|nr:ABC transporter permease subunit [Candidatus Limnocylindria bacterium]
MSVVDRLRRPVDRLRRPAARPGTEQGGQRAPRAGWPIVAAKELADDLLDARFFVLIGILGLVGAGTVYFSSDAIRSSASQASGTPSLFLLMFLIGQEGSPIPPFYSLIGFLLPLIGIAFGFDAINGERAQGTLPRLLSQPIHRDDVINGKFAAGLAVIATILVALTALVAGIGIVRLGISPSAEDVLRLIAWLVVSIVYVGFWLSFATLCSVAFRRAASSVLVSIGLWLGVTLFADFLVSAVASFLAPAGANASTEAVVNNAGWSQLLSQLSPSYLYQEATVVLFNPSIRTIGVLLPSQAEQLQTGGVPSPLSIDQSLLLVWPQIVAIVALTVISFAVAYVLFLRQEVRA